MRTKFIFLTVLTASQICASSPMSQERAQCYFPESNAQAITNWKSRLQLFLKDSPNKSVDDRFNSSLDLISKGFNPILMLKLNAGLEGDPFDMYNSLDKMRQSDAVLKNAARVVSEASQSGAVKSEFLKDLAESLYALDERMSETRHAAQNKLPSCDIEPISNGNTTDPEPQIAK